MQQIGPTIELDEASTSNSVDSTVADSIRNHPLMPILELLCEKCADATETMQPRAFQMNDVFKLFEKLEAKGVSTNTGNEKLDKFMRDAVLVIRTHLFELQKVASLADDFYTKYLQALRRRISHEVLIGVSGDSDDDLTEPNQNDELLSSNLEQRTVAILTTPQGTVSISLSPRTTMVRKSDVTPPEEIA
ncbi:hypothetical protein V3C99_002603 [Haemonchus contortus]